MIKEAARAPRASASPELSLVGNRDKEQFPGFYPTLAPHSLHGPVFLALVSWVGLATGADLFLFAAPGPTGWQVTGHAQARRRGDVAGGAGYEDLGPSLAAGALSYQGLMEAVAERRGPSELTREFMATVCPSLVSAGIEHAVGTPVYGPSRVLAAVVVAAYRADVATSPVVPGREVASVGWETIACIGKLLARAQSGLLSSSPPAVKHIDLVERDLPNDALRGDPDDLLVCRDVAAIFAVCPRTITNWARRGTLATTRTAGGDLRFRRSDVLALHQGRPV
jgi:hypothetical protein